MSDYTQEPLLVLELARVRAENAALAAHVEWLDGLRRNVIEAIRDDRFEDLDVSFYRDDKQPPKPATSLARIKAEWQADALERLGPGLVDIIDRSQAKRMAAELRRQAEGGDQP